ncbi:sensor histidine kinase [Streptomyces sp. NBC_00454]|uniref:sensor histidine kinase n=1 Tax=Streptomyces sp. NBC_00454 TaxID=2975747 RepID=UPI0030E020ED
MATVDRGDGAGAFGWTRNDALVAIGAAAVDLFGYSLGTIDSGRPLEVSALALVVLAAFCLLARRRHPVAVLAVVVLLDGAVNLTTPLGTHFTAGLAIAVYSVGRIRGPGVTALAALVTVPLALVGRSGDWAQTGWGLLSNTVAAVLAAGAGIAVNRWQQEVDANRTLLAERAVVEERRRIARELHDIVAHHVTAMQLMAGGARANLVHDPEAAREALVTLEGSGRMALREMRQLLDVLRTGEEPEPERGPAAPQPGTADLDRIVTESRLAGTETAFTVAGPVRPLPPALGLTVFRIVQESLTNIRKHAGPARADVRLTYRPHEVTVEITDDGTGSGLGDGGDRPEPSRSAPRSGYGLIGMRERAALQGGTLEAAALRGGGFRVAARLPVPSDPVIGVPGGEGEVEHR